MSGIQAIINRQREYQGATPGTLNIEGVDHPIFHTLELPWADNAHDVSCIPTGTYPVVPHNWNDAPGLREFRVWEVTNVPHRTGVLIHPGNTVKDIKGCVLVGQVAGTLDGLPAVLHSQSAIEELRRLIGDRPFTLTIS